MLFTLLYKPICMFKDETGFHKQKIVKTLHVYQNLGIFVYLNVSPSNLEIFYYLSYPLYYLAGSWHSDSQWK